MSIRDILNKFKGFFQYSALDDVVLIAIIFFLAFASFGLGRLSVQNETKPGIYVGERGLHTVPAAVYAAQETAGQGSEDTQVSVVGSKNGTVYHFPWCSGAQRIKEENKIYFSSFEEARDAGYRAAKNCKGLE